MRFALGCIFFKKKGKEKKILQAWLFQSRVREGKHLFTGILFRNAFYLLPWLWDVCREGLVAGAVLLREIVVAFLFLMKNV